MSFFRPESHPLWRLRRRIHEANKTSHVVVAVPVEYEPRSALPAPEVAAKLAPSEEVEFVHQNSEAPKKEEGFFKKAWTSGKKALRWAGKELGIGLALVKKELRHARPHEKVAIVGSVVSLGIPMVPGAKVAISASLSLFSPELAVQYALVGEPILTVLGIVLALFATVSYRNYVIGKLWSGIKLIGGQLAKETQDMFIYGTYADKWLFKKKAPKTRA